jgi:uncharacterized membrane protein
MRNSIKYLLNIIFGIILICYIIYITDTTNKKQHYNLKIISNSRKRTDENKIYRFIILLIITFSAIGCEKREPNVGENYMLSILLSIAYLQNSNLVFMN